MLEKGGRNPRILREKPGIGGGQTPFPRSKGTTLSGANKGCYLRFPAAHSVSASPLPLPMGEVAERSEDGEGRCKALSVTCGDSSPKGGAKGVRMLA